MKKGIHPENYRLVAFKDMSNDVRAYCLKTQPATGETYPKSDLFNKASFRDSAGEYREAGPY